MTWFTLVQVLPGLVQLVFQFINLVKNKGAPASLGAISQALDKLKQAQTHDDHQNAAKDLANALAGKQT